jgi:predicted dehydrogenase
VVSGRVAVIGAGSIGRRHADNLRTLGVDVDHIAWREFSADAFAKRRDLSAVVIATATQIRLELIEICAQMDLPFYVEKPLAWNVAQVEAIYAAAAPVAARSMVGFMMRYHPALRALAAEDLSDIYSFSMEIGHDVRQWRANWRFGDSYAARPEGGGVLLDLSHEVDMARALFPQLALCSAQSLGHADYPGVDFATSLHLAAPDGPMGCVTMDYLSPVFIRTARLRGLNRLWEIDFLKPELVQITPEGRQATAYNFERNDMFLGAMRDFLALASGGVAENPLAPRFDTMRATNALVAEAWAGRQFAGTVAVDMG